MAEHLKKPGILHRFDVASFVVGVLEKIVSNWTTLATYVGGGALMSALAWFQQLPPLYWGSCFFAGLILVSFFRLLNAATDQRKSMAKYAERHAQSSSINPLAKDFEDQQLNAHDFYHPYFQPRRNLVFRNCELFGPANLFINGDISFRTGCFFHECTAVIVKNNQSLTSAVFLRDVTFTDCNFYRLSILMTAHDAKALKHIIPFGKPGLPVITDGTYGEI